MSDLSQYRSRPEVYLVNGGSNMPVNCLVASAAVKHRDRILLLQRAAHSFQALLWELPGGRCEPTDQSVVDSAARELREETGITASRAVGLVGEYEWLDKGRLWRKVTFLMEASPHEGSEGGAFPDIKLDPKEQASFIWATEKDVLEDRCGDVPLKWTSVDQKEMVLRAFKLSQRASE